MVLFELKGAGLARRAAGVICTPGCTVRCRSWERMVAPCRVSTRQQAVLDGFPPQLVRCSCWVDPYFTVWLFSSARGYRSPVPGTALDACWGLEDQWRLGTGR